MSFDPSTSLLSERQKQLQEHGYTSVKNLLDKDTLEALSLHCLKVIWSPKSSQGDRDYQLLANTRNKYGDPITDQLLITLADKVGQVCDRRLVPTYSFFRFYPKGSGMQAHKDRAACEYSVSLCLKVNYENLKESQPSYQWPLYCNGTPMFCNPGDGIIYKGCEVQHWREPLQGNFHLQLFLHYVDANGPYAKTSLFDGRQALGALRTK